MLTTLKNTGVDQLKALARWLNPIRGHIRKTTRQGTTFRFDPRWSLDETEYVTFQPYLATTVTTAVSYNEDLCGDMPLGYVLRIVLGKPHIRDYDDRIEIDFVVRVFYTYGGDEVTFTHVLTPDNFYSLPQPPGWTMIVTEEKVANTLRPWVCSPNMYRILHLDDDMNTTTLPP